MDARWHEIVINNKIASDQRDKFIVGSRNCVIFPIPQRLLQHRALMNLAD